MPKSPQCNLCVRRDNIAPAFQKTIHQPPHHVTIKSASWRKKKGTSSVIYILHFFFFSFFVIYKAMINFQAKKPRQNFMSFHENLSKISLHFMKIYRNFPSSIRQQLPKLSSFFQTSCLERLMVACICSLSLYSHWLSSRIKDQSHRLTGVAHTV